MTRPVESVSSEHRHDVALTVPALLLLAAAWLALGALAGAPPSPHGIDPTIPPGLYAAGQPPHTIRVYYTRGGMVHYWRVVDPATAHDLKGKVLRSMTVAKFKADGYKAVPRRSGEAPR